MVKNLSRRKAVAPKIPRVDETALNLYCAAERWKVLASPSFLWKPSLTKMDVNMELERRWAALGSNEKDAYLNPSKSITDYFQYVADNWQGVTNNRPGMSGFMIQTILWDHWEKKHNPIKIISKDNEYKVNGEEEAHKLTQIGLQIRKDTEFKVDPENEGLKLTEIAQQIRKDTEFKVDRVVEGHKLTKIELNKSSSAFGKDVRPISLSEGSFSVFVESIVSASEKEMPCLNHEDVTEALKQMGSYVCD